MEREDCRVCRCLKIPGFCFDPSDEQLLSYYLAEKIEGKPLPCNHSTTELKIYDDDMMPWEILKDDNPYWINTSSNNKNSISTIKKTIYVFTELRKKRSRVIRRSGGGSWTGQNNPMVKNKAGNDIGYNKLLTFCEDNDDRKSKKKKIANEDHGHWIMHEYSLFGNDSYVLCKIIKEVKFSSKATMCPTERAAKQDLYSNEDAEIMNVLLDGERQSAGDDQPLDEFTRDWIAELCGQLGINISDVQELPIHSQPISTSDAQEGFNMICDKQVPNFLVEDEAIAAVNQLLDDPLQGQSILDFSLKETDAVVQDLAVVCGKNGKRDESYNGLDGAENHNIIILDDSSTGVDDVQEIILIGEADLPQIQLMNVDDEADYSVDDFWNSELVGADIPSVSPTNTTWDGFDVILDFSSPDLFDLWGDETNEFEGQPEKRMRHGDEDYEECPSGKKQRFL